MGGSAGVSYADTSPTGPLSRPCLAGLEADPDYDSESGSVAEDGLVVARSRELVLAHQQEMQDQDCLRAPHMGSNLPGEAAGYTEAAAEEVAAEEAVHQRRQVVVLDQG